jgi:hypothetical protein
VFGAAVLANIKKPGPYTYSAATPRQQSLYTGFIDLTTVSTNIVFSDCLAIIMERVAGFSPPGFDPTSGQVGIVVNKTKWHWGPDFVRVLRFPLPILIPQTFTNRGCYNRKTSGRRTKVDTTLTPPHEKNKNRKLFWGVTECSPVEVHLTLVGTASIFRVEE